MINYLLSGIDSDKGFTKKQEEYLKNDINSNSSRWGNYKDVLNTVSSDNAKRIDGSWKLVSKDEKI